MSERISRAPLIYEIDTRSVVGVASFSTGKSTMLSSLYNGQGVRFISLGLPSCPFSSFLAHVDSILPQLKSGRARNFLFFRTARHEFHRVRWFPSLSSGRVFSPLEMHCSSPYRRLRFRKRNGILLCLAPEYRFPRRDTGALSNSRRLFLFKSSFGIFHRRATSNLRELSKVCGIFPDLWKLLFEIKVKNNNFE